MAKTLVLRRGPAVILLTMTSHGTICNENLYASEYGELPKCSVDAVLAIYRAAGFKVEGEILPLGSSPVPT